MGDVVNLRKLRKQSERLIRQKEAAENRLRYGRSKSERKLAEVQDAKNRRDLDQHRIKTGDEP